jgi:hypothetical protein
MATIATEEALQGYKAEAGAKCPYYATSVSGDAWAIGRWLNQTGRAAPREVRKSRGNSYRVNDMVIHVEWKNGTPVIERIS